MRIDVRFLDKAETRCEITLTPGWIGRLFGRRPRRGVATRYLSKAWRWERTDNEVGAAITREIECTAIEPLPGAKVQPLRLKERS